MTSTISIDFHSVLCPDFLGLNGTYHGFAFMPEQVNRGMNDADRAREFERVGQLGLNIARTWYRPDWACGAGLDQPYDWHSTKMEAFTRWLAEMQRLGVDVALQAGWWFTRDTYYGFDSPEPARDIPLYTRWVSESLHELIEVRGFTHIKYLILLTEPTSYESGQVPAGEQQWPYYVKGMRALDAQLRADSRRGLVKLVGPNNSFGGVHLAEAVQELDEVIDIYSGHDYNYPGYAEWHALCRRMQALAAPTGKPVWLDEYGKQDEAYRLTADYGNYIAQAAAASINAGNQASIIWLLLDQQYVSVDLSNVNTAHGQDSFYHGVHRWGLCKWPADEIDQPTHPYPHWYAFSLLSRALGGRNGTASHPVTFDGQVVGAATSQGEDASIVVVNLSHALETVAVRLAGRLARPLRRFVYDPGVVVPAEDAALLKPSKWVQPPGQGFSDVLPPRAVVVYTTREDLE